MSKGSHKRPCDPEKWNQGWATAFEADKPEAAEKPIDLVSAAKAGEAAISALLAMSNRGRLNHAGLGQEWCNLRIARTLLRAALEAEEGR